MLPELNENVARARIARRIAMELEDGALVNLGIGIPTLVSDYLPNGVTILLQTENGAIGAGPKPEKDENSEKSDLRVTGAGGRPISLVAGGAFISSEMSFGIIRGGHLDATVLGAMEVDEKGSIANWCVPGKNIPGMGGAMDLVSNSKKVYAAMRHTDSSGRPKLLKKCSLPLTAKGKIDIIVTEFCLIKRIGNAMRLCEIADDVNLKDLLGATEMTLEITGDIKTADFSAA